MYGGEENPLLMEESCDRVGEFAALGERKHSSLYLRLVVSCYLWFALPTGIVCAFACQLLAHLLLWPVFWIRPSLKVWLMGWIFRSFVTLSAFFFNPFWKVNVVRTPTNPQYKPEGRTLVMCNHLTQADPWIFARALWPWEMKWVYKAELRRIPIGGQVLAMAQDIPLTFTKDRGGWGTVKTHVLTMMNHVYETGQIYNIGTVIFPEGTRSVTGRLQPFKDGFFKFAIEKQWEILPVVGHNNQSLWPLGSLLQDVGTAYVAIGDPIKPFPGENFEDLKFRVRDVMIEMIRNMPLFDPALDEPLRHDAEVLDRGRGILGQ